MQGEKCILWTFLALKYSQPRTYLSTKSEDKKSPQQSNKKYTFNKDHFIANIDCDQILKPLSCLAHLNSSSSR